MQNNHKYPLKYQIVEGPLSKWTNVVKGWQCRWFVLDQTLGLFSYYTSKQKMKLGVRRGCIRLVQANLGLDDEEHNTFTITDLSNDKTFHFMTKDMDERNFWLKHLEYGIQMHNKNRGRKISNSSGKISQKNLEAREDKTKNPEIDSQTKIYPTQVNCELGLENGENPNKPIISSQGGQPSPSCGPMTSKNPNQNMTKSDLLQQINQQNLEFLKNQEELKALTQIFKETSQQICSSEIEDLDIDEMVASCEEAIQTLSLTNEKLLSQIKEHGGMNLSNSMSSSFESNSGATPALKTKKSSSASKSEPNNLITVNGEYGGDTPLYSFSSGDESKSESSTEDEFFDAEAGQTPDQILTDYSSTHSLNYSKMNRKSSRITISSKEIYQSKLEEIAKVEKWDSSESETEKLESRNSEALVNSQTKVDLNTIPNPIQPSDQEFFMTEIDSEDEDDLDMGNHKNMVSFLLSQVRIGMDLTRIALPTFILE